MHGIPLLEFSGKSSFLLARGRLFTASLKDFVDRFVRFLRRRVSSQVPVSVVSASRSRPRIRRRLRPPPEPVEVYYVPRCVLEVTHTHLKERGRKGEEGYVFWVGAFGQNGDCLVTGCLIPKVSSSHGGVRIPPEKMAAIAHEVRKRDLLIVAQVHSHPGRFGHSTVDEVKAVSCRRGFVSIVVPDLAQQRNLDLTQCLVYEYLTNGEWRMLPLGEIVDRFVVEEHHLRI